MHTISVFPFVRSLQHRRRCDYRRRPLVAQPAALHLALPPCFIHHRPSPSDARPAVSAACPAQPSFNCFPRPPSTIAVLIDNPTFTFAAPRHTRTVAHSIPTTPRGLADRCGPLHDAASSRDGLGC